MLNYFRFHTYLKANFLKLKKYSIILEFSEIPFHIRAILGLPGGIANYEIVPNLAVCHLGTK